MHNFQICPLFFVCLIDQVLWNPFDDIITRQVVEKPHSSAKADAEGQKQKAKAVKYVYICLLFTPVVLIFTASAS